MTDIAFYLTQKDLATRWKVSIRTLERWRDKRYGPAWITLGGSIRYSFADVRAFEAGQRSPGCAGANELVVNTSK